MSKLIPESSILRRHPQNLHPRQRLILDGIRYSVEITELAYHRLAEKIITISQSNKGPLPSDTYASVLADAWTIIDSINRLGVLASLISKASEIDYVKDFLKRTEVVRKMRNAVQHLHGRLDKLLSLKQPTWGTLSWVTLEGSTPTKGKIHLLVPGSIQDGMHHLPNPAGEKFKAFLDLITLNAHGFSARIVDLMEEVANFIGKLQESLSKQFKEFPHAAAELYIWAEFEFKPQVNPESDDKGVN